MLSIVLASSTTPRMTDLDDDPSGVVLLLLGYAFLAAILFLSLSTIEKVILASACLAFYLLRRYRRFDIFKRAFEHVSARLTPSQKFSEQADQIYKTRLQGPKIRLLRLLPGEKEAKLQCRLVEASLDKVPSYEAISYVHGRLQKREVIECNGHVACITTSLAQALRRMRSKTLPRTLWADGICINQDDLVEKAHQVERMGEIFKEANGVAVWLGPDMDGTISKALTIIRYINEKSSESGHGASSPQHSGDLTIKNLERLIERDRRIGDAWAVLEQLFAKKWWQRVWCVQEAILAKSTSIMCGEAEIDGNLIGVFTKWHHSQRWAGQPNPPHFNDAGVTSAYRRLNKWDWSSTFLEILDTFRGQQATDPRDKVYALLGLLQSRQVQNVWNSLPPVDYAKTVPEVFFDSVMYSVRSEGTLHFLSYVDHRLDLEDRGRCPSWMPCWTEMCESWPDHLWCNSSSLSAGIRCSIANSAWTYSETLVLRGARLDSISMMSDTCWPGETDIGDELYDWILCHLLWIDDQSKNDWQKQQSLMTRLATTLTGGYLKSDSWTRTGIYFEHLEEPVGRQYMANFYSLLRTYFSQQDIKVRKPGGLRNIEGHAPSYHQLIHTYCAGRRLFHTQQGHIGLGPRSMRDGDVVVVLEGGKVPFVLRDQKTDEFALIGECFVYDVMACLDLDALYSHGYEEEDFMLR